LIFNDDSQKAPSEAEIREIGDPCDKKKSCGINVVVI
jgi:hypothetical protein